MSGNKKDLIIKRGTRSVIVKGRIMAAPMAGALDPPYRIILHEHGCPMSFTEMISSRGLVESTDKTLEIIRWDQEWGQCGAQLFGSDPEFMAISASELEKKGFPVLDINSGCPKRKVLRGGGGGALMKHPDVLLKCTGNVLDEVKIPVGVKLRGGWNEKRKRDILRIADELEGIGISHISVHPRTVRQGYSGNADHELTESLSRRVDIPVIASGDIQNGSEAVSLISKGLDGVMIGRALLGNPLWFELLGDKGNSGDDPRRIKKMILDVALDHLDRHMRFHSTGSPIAKFRKHISWYLKGVPGKRRYLERIYRTEDEEEVRDILIRIRDDLGSITSEHRVNLPNF